MTLIDPRIAKQAEILVNYSLKVKRGENVIISGSFEAKPLMLEIYKLLIKKGANEVKVHFEDSEFTEEFFKNATKTQLSTFPKTRMNEIMEMDCYIHIGSEKNTRALSNIDPNKISLRSKTIRPITNFRVENTRWVITRFPTNAQAQEANMSLADYEDFVFASINEVDWKALKSEQENLRKLMDKTKRVRIVGKDTDLAISIEGRKAANAYGSHNMPDGEVFTSAVENSAQGHITYDYPALYMGKEFTNIRLEFKKGKVVSATADKGEKNLNKILDMDEGARFIGELGIGNNFGIKKHTKSILFDEKIGGSIHIALGKGYAETLSKNTSALHWDMIKDLRNGGELWFDDVMVQRNGKWRVKI